MKVAEMRLSRWMCWENRIDKIRENSLRRYGRVERRKNCEIVKKVGMIGEDEDRGRGDQRKSGWTLLKTYEGMWKW